MERDTTRRRAAAAGIAGSALAVGALVLVGIDSPGADTPRGEIIATYGDDGTGGRQALGVLAMALAAACLIPFVAAVRRILREAAGESSPLPATAFAGGLLLIGLLAVSSALGGSVSAAAGYFDETYRVNADLALTIATGTYYLHGLAATAAGVMIAAASAALWQPRLMPRPFLVLGFALGLLSLAGPFLGTPALLAAALWSAIFAAQLTRHTPTHAHTPAVAGATAT